MKTLDLHPKVAKRVLCNFEVFPPYDEETQKAVDEFLELGGAEHYKVHKTPHGVVIVYHSQPLNVSFLDHTRAYCYGK